MGKRIRLGLIFSADEKWIGGTYYILNLISALGSLPEERQPRITILSRNKSDFAAAKKTGYQFLKYYNPFDIKRNLPEAVINKIGKFFTRKDIIDKRISAKQIDVLFPATNEACFERIQNKVYWFPDFQHVFYPGFFKQEELKLRDKVIAEIAASFQKLVVSSNDARRHWEEFPVRKNCSVHVIPFAVSHPDLTHVDIAATLKEFDIAGDYFIICNQFWQHKNHIIVLQAAAEIMKQGLPVQFVFTGKEDDYRNPGYYETLLAYIKNNQLSNIKLLGLIDRGKQLRLMQYSVAVIQPSLFEGWSTVIEDAKALGKKVIASDIPVNREQLKDDGLFFDPADKDGLAEKIKEVIKDFAYRNNLDYHDAVKNFGNAFLELIG